MAGLFCNDIQMKQLEGALVNQVFCINHPHSSPLPPIDHIYLDIVRGDCCLPDG